MLFVADQLERLESLLVETGGLLTESVARLDPWSPETIGTFRASLTYDTGHSLHVAVTLDTVPGYPLWISYSFHLMDSAGRTVLRYDNAPHHPELEGTFPHHRHVGPDERPEEALPRLRDILRDVTQAVGL